MKNNNTIPAVDKALSAIEYMCSEGRSVTQAEICRAAGVTATTGYRIVQTLIRHNWIRRTRGNSYSLSLGMLDVWMKSRSHGVFFENIQPILDALASTTRLACKLSIRQGDEQVSVLRAESPEPFSVSGKNGARFPVIEGSVGTVLLCGESEAEIRRLCETCTADIPEKNNPELLLSRIREARKLGYMFNKGTNRWRVDAMSMPVTDCENRIIAVVTLLGIQDDFTGKNMHERAAKLAETVRQIEAEL